MKEETFEQRRIVQLSKELDAERDKYAKLAKDSGFLNSRLKECQDELEESKEKLIEYQINNHRLSQNLRQMQRENQKLRDNIEKQQHLRSEAEVQNVRQRQKLDELKQELEDYENKTKAILFERTNEIAIKDKEIYRIKEENIEIQKMYLNEKEKLQRREEKHLRDLAMLYQNYQALKKQLNSVKLSSERALESQRARHKRELNAVLERIEQLQAKLRKEEELKAQIQSLKGQMQEVVMQNSQKIIELYKYKYAK